MPFNNTPKAVPPLPPQKDSCWYCGPNSWGDFGKKLLLTLAGVLLVYLIFYVGTLVRNNIKKFDYIGKADRSERVVTVNGYGKVTGNNDIAVTTLGFANIDKDVSKAQAENKKVMDKVTAELKQMKVADKDLQANYTIYPEYNYTSDKGQELKGYRVSHQLTVKIRDLSQISNILGLAGKYGLTEVSGLSFTIDDPENLKAQARTKALADAQAKAAYLSVALGVRVVGVVSYSEYESGNEYYAPVRAYGMAEGGGGPESVPSGSKDVAMNVSITYEISPK